MYTRKFFDPDVPVEVDRDEALRGGDRPHASPYVYNDRIILAVNIAMAANRPLLVAGPAGSGKSALAGSIAKQKQWEYGQQVITARTQARDLQWRFDAIARLHDARATEERVDLDPVKYIKKEVLWQAFEASQANRRMVVLLDEIDKADPDLPNSLLETLGAGTFYVDELSEPVALNRDAAPFIVITTNNERDLSRPFVRRCVTLTLPAPRADRLLEIARAWNLASGTDEPIASTLADEVEKLTDDALEHGDAVPGTAEYLDALRTCILLEIEPGSDEWNAVRAATLTKQIDEDAEPESGPDGTAQP